MRLLLSVCVGVLLSFSSTFSFAQDYKLNYVPLSTNVDQQGFIRIVNDSSTSATVYIDAIDDSGRSDFTYIRLTAGESKQLTIGDIENGNSSKGVSFGIGPGIGNWRLTVSSSNLIMVMGYIRSPSGFLSPMHATSQAYLGGIYHAIPMFNPGSNANQQSRLRIINNSGYDNDFLISGIDDGGKDAPNGSVSLRLKAYQAATFSSQDLENGNAVKGLSGSLGKGTGKWRLSVVSTYESTAMSFMELPGGYVSNTSDTATEADTPLKSALTCDQLDGASVYSQEEAPIFLGFFGSQFAMRSIYLTAGDHGSSTSTRSMRNKSSSYGSTFGPYSANNTSSTLPPIIVRNGVTLGYVTTNKNLFGGYSLSTIDASCSPFDATKPVASFRLYGF